MVHSIEDGEGLDLPTAVPLLIKVIQSTNLPDLLRSQILPCFFTLLAVILARFLPDVNLLPLF